ncbi:serine/threonine protein kinase [bacterium]|nr:serine/threonine protein kinase [bacterium]
MSAKGKVIVYDSLPAKTGLLYCDLTLPLWGVVAPGIIALVWLLAGTYHTSRTTDLQYSSFELAGVTLPFLLIFFLGVIVTASLHDNRIVVSQQGLTLPFFKSLGNKLDTFIEWQSIEKVFLSDCDLQKIKALKMKILTKDGGTVNLQLKNIAASDIEFLLVSLNTWAPVNSLDNRLGELKEILWNLNSQAKPSNEIAASYTKLWEDELAGRFSATAYIPLNPNQMLQDKSIKVVRQLAFGGWSAIYLIRETNTKLRVLKELVIPPGANAELKAKASAMFDKEAELLLKLDNPNIVKVQKHFTEDDRHYLILDYITGQTLRQLVNLNGRFHPLDVIDYAQQICQLLSYLHGQEPPILHRDLTPDNLMVDSDGKLMLIDFGAANELLGTATGTLVGKQSYISPEQFAGHATEASDLYSLGATLFFMLTGRDPEPLTQSSVREVEIHVSDKLDKLVQSLTAQDHKERPASAADVKQALSELG